MGWKGTACLPTVLTTVCRGVCPPAPEAPPPGSPRRAFFIDLRVCRATSLIVFLLSYSFYIAFCPFLSTLSQRSHHLGWGAQLSPVVGLLKWLELVVFIMGLPGYLVPEATPSTPCGCTLSTCTQYDAKDHWYSSTSYHSCTSAHLLQQQESPYSSKFWQLLCVCSQNEGVNISSLFTKILYFQNQFEN